MNPPETWRFEDEQDDLYDPEGCYYGLSEFCVDQFARDTGCTVNCGLYMEISSGYDRPKINYKLWKLKGLIFTVLLGAWTACIIPPKSPVSTNLNTLIAALGVALMLLIVAIERRGEI